MKFAGLVVKSARRNKRRTALTVISVAMAVFLFAALRAVLDGFHAAVEASSSTRIVTIRSTSLIFSMPTTHAETIKTVAVITILLAGWRGKTSVQSSNQDGGPKASTESSTKKDVSGKNNACYR